jgi:hypothetical protein
VTGGRVRPDTSPEINRSLGTANPLSAFRAGEIQIFTSAFRRFLAAVESVAEFFVFSRDERNFISGLPFTAIPLGQFAQALGDPEFPGDLFFDI